MKKTLFGYALALTVFLVGIAALLHFGKGLETVAIGVKATKLDAPQLSALRENAKDPLSRLLLQVIVIVAATRGCGLLFRRIGQPAVIGEIAAGIMLGPSLLGWLWPGASTFVFPAESLGTLKLFSQIGVCLFMFVVGLELEIALLRKKAHSAVVVSHAGIMVPYLLGVAASLALYPRFATPGTSFLGFALFMGIAMSITAFPVLAKILEERGMSKTFLGTTAIACAAVEDATAWIVLAFVVAIIRATGMASTAFNLAMVAVFVGGMLFVVRPLLARLSNGEGTEPSRGMVAGILVFMAASALATEMMGLHALFGAFLAGVVMPEGKRFREDLAKRAGSFGTLFLLPLFFAFSGLRTRLGLLDDAASWVAVLGIVGIAVAGKLGGCTVAARLTGLGWNDAFSLGALMNTRGLVELVALNIGYELGILPPRIFTMMVLMALTTTFMTGPLLSLAVRLRRASPVERVTPLEIGSSGHYGQKT